MGLVLRKSFKGKHVWIPTIPDQILKAHKEGLSQKEINAHLAFFNKE